MTFSTYYLANKQDVVAANYSIRFLLLLLRMKIEKKKNENAHSSCNIYSEKSFVSSIDLECQK